MKLTQIVVNVDITIFRIVFTITGELKFGELAISRKKVICANPMLYILPSEVLVEGEDTVFTKKYICSIKNIKQKIKNKSIGDIIVKTKDWSSILDNYI